MLDTRHSTRDALDWAHARGRIETLAGGHAFQFVFEALTIDGPYVDGAFVRHLAEQAALMTSAESESDRSVPAALEALAHDLVRAAGIIRTRKKERGESW